MKPSPATFRALLSAMFSGSPKGMSALKRPPLLPRLTTLKNNMPLPLERSAGRRISMSVTYSTAPLAFFGREANILDDSVCREVWVHLSVGATDHPLVGPDRSKLLALEGRLDFRNFDTGYSSLRRRCTKHCRQDR